MLRKITGTRPPRVLFLNRTYPPAEDPSGIVLRDMAVNLVQRGWQVTVLTGASEVDTPFLSGGVRVVRVTFGGVLQRYAAPLVLYPALVVRALRLGTFDVVATKSDPPFLHVIGWLLGLLLRARTVHWVDALYPETSEAMGVLRAGGPLAHLLRSLSSFFMRRQDRVIAVGRCMEERLRARGVPDVTVVPNWPLQSLQPIEHRFNAFRREHDLQGKFVVIYSGRFGKADALDPLLDAAEEIKGAYPDIRFLLIGDGPERARVAARIRESGLENVRLLPVPPVHEGGSNGLSAGDLHVVSMDERAGGLVVPTRLYDAMAVRRPCLFLGPEQSEASLFVREHGAGEVVSSSEGLAFRIIGWYQNDIRRRIAGNRAYRAVRLLRANALIDFEDLLRDLLAHEQPEPAQVPQQALAA